MTEAATAERPAASGPDAEALRVFLDGEHREIRERVRESLRELKPVWNMDRDEYRDLVLDWMHKIAESGQPQLLFPEEH
ncbi:MAG: hypothetical protein QOG63_1196, partial [Thermoleophilaceae bacterium]|nr:hypothetical protein [Thermoleophilaceae bacterium]